MIKTKKTPVKDSFILLLILLAALFLRLYKIDQVPLNHDEARATIISLDMIREGRAESICGFPLTLYEGRLFLLYNYISLLFDYFFLDPLPIARLPGILIGVFTVFFVYLLAREYYDSRVGLLSSFFIACLPWHVITSRIVSRENMAALFGAVMFYLLYRGITEQKKGFFILSFFLSGIGSFYAYTGGIIMLPIFFTALVSGFLMHRNSKIFEKRSVITGLSLFLISILPVLILKFRGIVAVPSKHFLAGPMEILDNGFLTAFFRNFMLNLKKVFGLLYIHSNKATFGLIAPSLNTVLFVSPWFFPFFSAAFVYALFKRSYADLILIAWILCGLAIPVMVINNNEMWPRFIFLILTPSVILLARFLVYVWDRGSKIRKGFLLKFLVVVVAYFFINTSLSHMLSYFKNAPYNKDEYKINSFGLKETAEYLIKDINSRQYKIIASFRMTPLLCYLEYNAQKTEGKKHLTGTISKNFKIRTDLKALEEKFLSEKNTVYYVFWNPDNYTQDDDWNDLFKINHTEFKKMHPGMKPSKEIRYPDGTIGVIIFKIKPNA